MKPPKEICNVIATGSTGNAVLYHNSILVDIGVPYSLIEPYKNDIQIVLLTHEHGDHINYNTLEKLLFERPSVRIATCPWMASHIKFFRNIDIIEIGKLYDYVIFQISTVRAYHDVSNCGYRIFKDGYKIFHITDTAHLNGIEAKDYDLYCLEHNYDAETINAQIAEKEAKGEFSYQKGAINTHLSYQQAQDFFYENKKDDSICVRLHESKNS